jgi:PAS domain-containing protein
MLDRANETRDITDSIVDRMSGFMYRCRNDKDYSMIFMAGDVPLLTGKPAQAFTRSRGDSYAAMTHPDDLEAVYAAVDEGLANRSNWGVDYRIRRADGTDRWVHETGGGVWRGEELLFLEGIVIDTDTGKRAELSNAAQLVAISEQARFLLADTEPIVEILRTLRILAINARLEAGRAGTAGAAFGFISQEVSRLAEETSVLAEHIAEVTGQLQGLLQQT